MASEKILLDECNADLISKLPDAMLCHILSFMPTKFSVRTSVLSTRWKQLFTFVPILDFHHYEPTRSPNPSNFINIVYSVLGSYDVSRMKKFRLTLNNEYPTCFPVASWLSSVIHRNVSEIEITIQWGSPMTVPLEIFVCKTLVSLSLYGAFDVKLPHSVCLPCLRTCELLGVCFDDESAKRLFRSCPVLENLTLDRCRLREGVKVLDISAPALKSLFVRWCFLDCQVVLNVPNLLSFEYLETLANEFSGLQSLKLLVHAWIYYFPSSHSRSNVILELVRSICHVQHLQLYGEVKAFLCSCHLLPVFRKLTRLSLESFSCLSDLLDLSPRLEFISFDQGFKDNTVDETCFLTKHVPACVSRHLKEVSLSFTGLVHEVNVIKCFLKYAQNLKKMKIRTKLSWNEQLEISSAACVIVLV